VSTVGRPKEHDATTGAALLDAAERIVEHAGLAELSVRRVAELAGTTTRAVYAVFGSKEGLVVALGRRAFDWLAQALDELPAAGDPLSDVVESGVRVFRRLVVDHPALFKIGVQHTDVPPELVPQFRAEADNALARLHTRFQRLQEHGLLGDRNILEAETQLHALCEGLAAVELRCRGQGRFGFLPSADGEQVWRDALTALISGLCSPAAQPPRPATPKRRRKAG
jgi:AcrR family transcriptional regulator